ncbi:electron transfer flavoprotein subunit alpha/FixB family protein [Caldiplasma sukawensis]
MKILCYAETGAELSSYITKTSSLGEVYGMGPEKAVEDAKEYGAKEIYMLSGKILSSNLISALENINVNDFDLYLIESTSTGREFAGMISAKTGKQAISEIFDFSIEGDLTKTKRYFYGGKTIMEEKSKARILVVAPGTMGSGERKSASDIKKIEIPEAPVKVKNVVEKQVSSSNIESAQVIVSVGRGIGNKENIEKVKPLAEILHGEIAGSRPVCLDYRWLSEERQVGLSGKKVSPKVYIALGISGQIQHIAGMRGSKVVIAVNKDKDAPIFQESDYGIVGDIFQIVPKLVNALKN